MIVFNQDIKLSLKFNGIQLRLCKFIKIYDSQMLMYLQFYK